ncbi:hypothetical protein PSEUDO9AZ_10777 [Pseudomonas sp. 9AZ]|nr:hypothetical protein PSEUDO9AZ_10777 [Pseudomonas sp. 9AZ]
MQGKSVVVSVVIACMLLIPMLSVANWSAGEKAQAIGETVLGQVSKPIGAALTTRDVVQVLGAHGCNAYLLDLAIEAVQRQRYAEALELDHRRKYCFRSS